MPHKLMKTNYKLTDSELSILGLMFQCFEDEPKVDYDKLVRITGVKISTAKNYVRGIKKKLKSQPRSNSKRANDESDNAISGQAKRQKVVPKQSKEKDMATSCNTKKEDDITIKEEVEIDFIEQMVIDEQEAEKTATDQGEVTHEKGEDIDILEDLLNESPNSQAAGAVDFGDENDQNGEAVDLLEDLRSEAAGEGTVPINREANADGKGEGVDILEDLLNEGPEDGSTILDYEEHTF